MRETRIQSKRFDWLIRFNQTLSRSPKDAPLLLLNSAKAYTHHNVVVKVQRAIHFVNSEHHNDRMHQIRAVSQPRQRIYQPERQQAVDHSSVPGAALNHDEGYTNRPGGVSQGGIRGTYRHG